MQVVGLYTKLEMTGWKERGALIPKIPLLECVLKERWRTAQCGFNDTPI